MAKRKGEQELFVPSKKLNIGLSLNNLPTDAHIHLIQFLETDDIVALRRTNQKLFRTLNLGNILTETEFFRFITRSSFHTGLIYPTRNPYPKIKFYYENMKLLHQIKPIDEIKRIVEFFGTDPNMPCGFENEDEWEISPYWGRTQGSLSDQSDRFHYGMFQRIRKELDYYSDREM